MATIYKRGKYYWIAYKDRHGRRRQESTKQTDERVAKNLKRHYEALEKSYQLQGTPLQTSILFSEWREEYARRRQGRVAPATLIRDRQALDSLSSALDGDPRLNAITPADLETWYSCLLQSRAVATANCLYRHVKACFSTAVQAQQISESPCQIRKVKEVESAVRVLTKREVDQILWALPQEWADPVKVSLYTGARAGEICRLKTMDLSLDASPPFITIHSTTENPTKSKRHRVVPLPAASMPFFQDLAARRPYRGPLLVNPSGNPWGVLWLTKGFSKWMKRIDLDCSFHDLRRTYGAWLVMSGADLPTVQENLGHADISTTIKHYNHLVIGHRADQVNRLPEL